MPSVTLGAAIASIPGVVPHRGWLVFTGLAAVAASLGPTVLEWNGLAPSVTTGGIAAVVAWGVRRPASSLTIWFGGLAYGIYLIHPLVNAALGWSLGLENPIALGLGTIVFSACAVAFIRVTPFRIVT